MIYDGLEFFGFPFDKLPRLRGHKESYLDKLRDRKRLAKIFCLVIIATVLIIQEYNTVGTVRT